MLLQLENTTEDNFNKLIQFARQHNIPLTVMDDNTNDYYLPGKPLTPQQLNALIENSRKSGRISMQAAHNLIRSHVHGD